MVRMMNRHVTAPVAVVVTLAVTIVTALTYASAATTSATSSRALAAAARPPVAQSPEGTLRSRLVGSTAGGRDVTGTFVPLNFSKRNGKVFVRGLVDGVVHRAGGEKRTFGVVRTLRVKSINGTTVGPNSAARAVGSAAPPCDVLRLVLGPLDLDLQGLQVNLNRVVLNIVAQSGAGNLLGNLVCAVAGLLDGGLGGVLGRLTRLLDRILGRLGLGL
ncbi:hypothetical protein [Nocardioides sp. GXQ0305]|uniref:hypothetical protein n=1 Tax=Nocardioides sp. GXQ0305 TaxID=3423912 RepID=UPI003D7E97F3